MAFVLAFAGILGGARFFGHRWLDSALLAITGLLALVPNSALGLLGIAGLMRGCWAVL